MSRKNNGINETIRGWFKRVHPEKLWAIKEMPPTVTFKDMEKSMATGQGMGAPERYRTRGFRDLSRNFSDIVAASARDHRTRQAARYRERRFRRACGHH